MGNNKRSYYKILLNSTVNKFKRNLHNRKSSKKKKKESSIQIPKVVINYKILLFGLLALGSIFLGINYYFYYSLNPQKYLEADEASKIIDTSDMTTAFLVISENPQSDFTYRYVDLISIISFRDENLRILTINPDLKLQESDARSIRYYLNDTDDSRSLTEFNKQIEELTGLRIDRYIAVDSSDFKSYLLSKDIVVEADLIEDDEISSLSSNSFYNRIFSSENTSNNVLKAQQVFIEKYIEREFSFFKNYLRLFEIERYNNLFKTNMDRAELLTFLNRLASARLINSNVLGENVGVLQEEENRVFIEPNYILINEIVSEEFKDVNILAEQGEIEVYNATTIQGLALSATRNFRNIGINVVKFGNYSELSEENVLHVFSEEALVEFESTINSVRRLLNDDLVILVDEFKGNHTGNLILILGKEF